MITNNWNNSITYRGVTLPMVFYDLQPDPDFVIQKLDHVPFIACFTRKETLEFERTDRQFSRMIDTGALMDIFVDGSEIVRIHTRGRYYHVGKGMILDAHNSILAMLTVTNEFYETFDSQVPISALDIQDHFTMVIGTALTSHPAHRQVYQALKSILPSAGLDILYTGHPNKYAFANVRMPRFRTLRERRTYQQTLATEFINGLIEGVI